MEALHSAIPHRQVTSDQGLPPSFVAGKEGKRALTNLAVAARGSSSLPAAPRAKTCGSSAAKEDGATGTSGHTQLQLLATSTAQQPLLLSSKVPKVPVGRDAW